MRKALLSFALILAGFFALSSEEASAAPEPCPVGDQGWYMHDGYAIHCVMDIEAQHINAHWYKGSDDGSAFHGWIPGNMVNILFIGGSNTMHVKFCPRTANWFQILEPTPFPSQPWWDFRFKGTQYQAVGGGVLIEGAFWHNAQAWTSAPYGAKFTSTCPMPPGFGQAWGFHIN